MKDQWTALFTMFYYMYGDADFDVLYGANQVSTAYTLAWGLLWLWFGNNIIINLTLAVVENGYLDQKHTKRFAWVYDKVRDPEFADDHEEVEKNSLTPPDALRALQMRRNQMK